MKRPELFSMVTVIGILTVVGAAVSVHAQRNLNRPAPTPTPASPITRTPQGVLTRDRVGNEVLPPGIYGSVRWNKELGLPYDPSSNSRLSQFNCSVFRVTLSVRENASGPPRLLHGVHFVDNNPTELNGYYICSYGERDDAEVPRNQPLTITCDFESRIPGTAIGDWAVGSNTKPPPGQQRVIIIIGGEPNNKFMLTDRQTHAKVDFEMTYGPTSGPSKKPVAGSDSSGGLQTPETSGIRRIGTPASSRTEADPDPIPSNAVRIYIRYSKAFGYLSTATAFGNVGPYSCDAFRVDANVIGGPWNRSRGGNLSSIVSPSRMREEGSYYVCGFTVTDLPRSQIVNISAGMVNDSRIVKGHWLGEGQPGTPRGYERSILNGLQSITLSNKNPFEIATFEMVYARVTTPAQIMQSPSIKPHE